MGKFNELHIIRNKMFEDFGKSTENWDINAILKLGNMIEPISQTSAPIIIANVIEFVFKWPDIAKRYIEHKRGELDDF